MVHAVPNKFHNAVGLFLPGKSNLTYSVCFTSAAY